MIKLELLDIQENRQLSELPGSIARLRNLRGINLRNTKLESLPSGLKYWNNLVELIMKDNTQIEELPRTYPFGIEGFYLFN